jgi:hypothetical protein
MTVAQKEVLTEEWLTNCGCCMETASWAVLIGWSNGNGEYVSPPIREHILVPSVMSRTQTVMIRNHTRE